MLQAILILIGAGVAVYAMLCITILGLYALTTLRNTAAGVSPMEYDVSNAGPEYAAFLASIDRIDRERSRRCACCGRMQAAPETDCPLFVQETDKA